MSSAFAIAGVTHVLRELLKEGLQEASGLLGSSVDVISKPPDRVAAPPGAGSSEFTGLNLFLYRASPNLGWRNQALPSRDAGGRGRLTNPPLALDLHYILSAHGPGDLHAEILLGHAMLHLNDNAIVPRLAVRAALQSSAIAELAHSGLDAQVEQLKIAPEHLGSEELSKFWTAAQTSYRPCAAYQVSVVLIQASAPAIGPLPVLERKVFVRPDVGQPFPTLEAITSEDVPLGTKITLHGHDLESALRRVVLVNERVLEVIRPETGSLSPTRIEFTIADSDVDIPVGVYRVGARLGADPSALTTNQLALVVKPKITTPTIGPITRDPITHAAEIVVHFAPELRPGQVARLVLGQREYAPNAFSAPVSTLTFIIPDAEPGAYPLRLRIDGIDSAVIDLTDPAHPTFKRVVIQP
jgi:hypothetical protein